MGRCEPPFEDTAGGGCKRTTGRVLFSIVGKESATIFEFSKLDLEGDPRNVKIQSSLPALNIVSMERI